AGGVVEKNGGRSAGVVCDGCYGREEIKGGRATGLAGQSMRRREDGGRERSGDSPTGSRRSSLEKLRERRGGEGRQLARFAEVNGEKRRREEGAGREKMRERKGDGVGFLVQRFGGLEVAVHGGN
ncbi:hypothetical protein HAX54_028266, partial [Datura stramonium]|nr:hypothetical protein [Datura stramonium]